MSGTRRGALALAALGLAAAALAWWPGGPPPATDRPVPAFALPRLDDAGARLSPEQLRGRVWVLNVWASWCAPCREEHPLLVAVARESGVVLIGLNTKDDPRAAQEWLRSLGNPYLATAVDGSGEAVDAGAGLPQSWVVDQAGVVRHRHVGVLTRQAWDGELLPLIRRLQT